MNNIFFVSDTHFNHELIANKFNLSIINYNNFIINEWNKVVDKKDVVYHIGDFSCNKKPFSILELKNKLNGNINLIKGNHDKYNYNSFGFEKDYYELNIENKHIILFHYPIENWNRKHYGSIHLHGHTHIFENKLKNRFYVGYILKTLNDIINN